MSWKDDIEVAAYISPSGLRFEFQYENVSMSTNKKTSEFIFPEIDGRYIQDLGRSGRDFPFTVFFSGEDYHIESDSFLQALEETGIGTLEHPLYGTRKVIPTGQINRQDNIVTGANQAVFTITFSETIEDIIFPSSEVNQEQEIKLSISNYASGSSTIFSGAIEITDKSENAELQADLTDKVSSFELAMKNIIQVNDNIKNAFDTAKTNFDNNISTFTDDPSIIASQMITLSRLPANAVINATAMIEGYSSVITSTINTVLTTPNLYQNALLFISSLFVSVNESMLNQDFVSRPEAIAATNLLIDISETIKDWIDENIIDLEIEDTGEIYDLMLDVYSKTIIYLIQKSFDLPKEIFITLTEDRNIIELVAELYQDLDKLDFFITTNNLNSDQIELLTLGTEVVYYE